MRKVTLLVALAIAALTLTVSAGANAKVPTNCPGNSCADIHIYVECEHGTVTVKSSKDISYVKFNNGVKYDGLSGTHLTFGIPYGATEVTVKSGTSVKSAHINCSRH